MDLKENKQERLNNKVKNKSINKRKLGHEKEILAADYYREQKCEILESNFYCRSGEIDLIVKDKNYLVFAEVKYRKNITCGYPQEAVGYQKQRKIIQAARYYILTHQIAENMPCRFDVVAILGEKIVLIKNAFDII